jgi:hypothetical protein
MKKLYFAIATIAGVGSPALADEPVTPASQQTTLSVDGIGVLPVGDYGRVAKLGIGALGRIERAAGSGFVAGRIGVIFHAINEVDAQLTLVPLYAGYRFPVGAGGGYVAGELGLTLIFGTADTAFGRMSVSDTKLGFTLGGGLRRGALDLRAGLFAPDADNAVGLMASAGYDFAAF